VLSLFCLFGEPFAHLAQGKVIHVPQMSMLRSGNERQMEKTLQAKAQDAYLELEATGMQAHKACLQAL